MKIYLSKTAVKDIKKVFKEKSHNSYYKTANKEIAEKNRDENGKFEVSQKTLDLILLEMSLAFDMVNHPTEYKSFFKMNQPTQFKNGNSYYES